MRNLSRRLLGSRELWYTLLGIVPSIPMVIAASIFWGPMTWLAMAGFAGLCLATFTTPHRQRRGWVLTTVALLACGVLVAAIAVGVLLLVQAKSWPMPSADIQLLAGLVPPIGVAAHYMWIAGRSTYRPSTPA